MGGLIKGKPLNRIPVYRDKIRTDPHLRGWSYLSSLAPPTGLEPVTPWLTVRCSTDWATEEYENTAGMNCCVLLSVGTYLSSRAVAHRVLSTQTSLSTVFGMGTGGPSPPSAPTRRVGVSSESSTPKTTRSVVLRSNEVRHYLSKLNNYSYKGTSQRT